MHQYNLLIACDKLYYEKWAINFLKSLRLHVPWLSLHCHLVNVEDTTKLDYVDYTHETTEFVNDDQKLGYLQAVRFLAVANKFKNNESVITLDCDSLCVKGFSQQEFETLFEEQYILQHSKDNRWMAGFVTFNDNYFRQGYANHLLSKPIDEWPIGWDQTVMKEIAAEYKFVPVDRKWISIGKHTNNSAFITFKGTQKFKDKFLNIYYNFVERDNL
jgi:hypothetical protein